MPRRRLNTPRERKRQQWAKVKAAVADYDVEETLTALAQWLRLDAAGESHPAVVSALESAAESCDTAATNYYVSTK